MSTFLLSMLRVNRCNLRSVSSEWRTIKTIWLPIMISAKTDNFGKIHTLHLPISPLREKLILKQSRSLKQTVNYSYWTLVVMASGVVKAHAFLECTVLAKLIRNTRTEAYFTGAPSWRQPKNRLMTQHWVKRSEHGRPLAQERNRFWIGDNNFACEALYVFGLIQ